MVFRALQNGKGVVVKSKKRRASAPTLNRQNAYSGEVMVSNNVPKRNSESPENPIVCEIAFANPKAVDCLFSLHRARLINWRAFGLGVALSCFADRETGKTRLSRRRMAQITGIQTRDISRVIRELEQAHFFTVEQYVGRLNTYTLTLEPPASRGRQPSTRGRKAGKPVGELPPISISKKKDKQTTGSISSQAAKFTGGKVTWSDSGFVLPERIGDYLAAAFPLVDISAEIAKAHAWCCLNPGKAPSRDYGGFLFRWMSRTEPGDTGGIVAASNYTPPSSGLLAALDLEYEQGRREDGDA